jgi:hypothetical protein
MKFVYFPSQAAFDPEITQAMGRAYELARSLKPKASRDLIANRIIQLAKAGVRDSAILCAKVMEEFSERPRNPPTLNWVARDVA